MARKKSPHLGAVSPAEGTVNSNSSIMEMIDQVLSSVERIKTISKASKVLHKDALAEARSEECLKLIGKIEGLAGKVLGEATATRKLLSQLNSYTNSVGGNNKDSSVTMIRAKIKSVSGAFLKIMSQYERQESEYREKYRLQLERQYRLINPNASEEDLNGLSSSQTSVLLTKQIFRLSEDARIRRELESMKARDEEMNQLERSVQEIRILFEEISLLVQEQGESINKIEDYVIEIQGNVKATSIALEKAVQVARIKQRRRRMTFLIGLTVLSILILIIINELFPSLFDFS